MTTATPGVRPAVPHFSSGPCAKRPGWSLSSPQQRRPRPLAPRQDRQGEAQARHRPDPRGAGGPRRLPHRHRPGLRHRRGRDGAVVAARRAAGDDAGLGIFGEGWVTDVSKQLKLKDVTVLKADYGELPDLAKVDLGIRRRLHLERHHLGRARAERRLDRRRPRRPHRSATPPRPASRSARLAQARCRHLLLAEGAGRRRRARHADPVAARGRAARELHAALAAAEDLPPHQGRQAESRASSRARPSTRPRCCASRTISMRSAGPNRSAA